MLILAENKTDLSEKVRKLKGGSSYRFNRMNDLPTGSHLWAAGYDFRLITSEEQYLNTYRYIENNTMHHRDRWG
jgi:hypothetical protein